MRALGRVSQAAAALALAGALSVPAHAAVRAWLNVRDAAPGDTVMLTLERDGRANLPNLAPLRKDFDVLGTSASAHIEIINGGTASSIDLVVMLSPKHTGHLTIPSLSWGGEPSPTLTLNVEPAASASGAAGTAAQRKVFLVTQTDSAQPYVQAAVQLTVQLYSSETLYDPQLTLPPSNAVLLQRVGNDDDTTTVRGGADYEVVTRHYVLFPQHSGRLTLPGPQLDARVLPHPRPPGGYPPYYHPYPFGRFFGVSPFGGYVSSEPIRVRAAPIVLDVRARPAGAPASYWLPSSQVTLSGQWQPGSLQTHAGDPVTVQLQLQAVGLTASQLPDLSALWALPAGVHVYPDQAQLSNAAQGATVLGTRTQTIALIANRPGRLRIPALHVSWWDTRANVARAATLPARLLIVLPAATLATAAPAPAAAGAAAPAPSTTASSSTAAPPPAVSTGTAPAPAASSAPTAARAHSPAAHAAVGGTAPSQPMTGLPWPWISAALALAWLATIGVWLATRRARSAGGGRPGASAQASARRSRPGGSRARAAFRRACLRDDAPAARRALLAWARVVWHGAAPTGLNALSKKLDEPRIVRLLQELDRACYAGAEWHGAELAEALTKLPELPKPSAPSRSLLDPLYP